MTCSSWNPSISLHDRYRRVKLLLRLHCSENPCKVHLKPGHIPNSSKYRLGTCCWKHATLCPCHTFTFKIQKIPLAVNFIEDNNEHTDLWPARKTVQCAWLQTAAALYPGQKQPAQRSRSVNLFLEHTAAIILRIKSSICPHNNLLHFSDSEKSFACLFVCQLKTNKQSYSLFLWGEEEVSVLMKE